MIEPNTRFSINPDVISKTLGDESILVDLNSDRIFTLNDTGARIWECLSSGMDFEQIHHQLSEEYDIAAKKLSNELEETLSLLIEEDLIHPNAEN